MAIVGTAYVEIRAITNKLDSDIQSALNRSVDRAARDAGRRSGDNFRSGFNDGTRGLDRDAESAGRGAGDSYARGLERSSSRVRAAAENLGGGGGGNIFSKIAPDAEANRAGQAMRRVALQMDGLAAVAGVALGSVASLGASLFSLGASAGAASRSLIVLPSILGAVIQGAVTSSVAFQGIGDALKANANLQKASATASTAAGTAAASSAKAQQTAARAVESAQQRLGDVIRSNARSTEQAARRVQDAQQQVADTVQANARSTIQAQRRVADAQQGLTDAVEAGARAAQQAARRVADAQQDLQDTYQSTAASIMSAQRGVRDAERSLADAQRGSLRAQQALTDARKEAIEDLQELTFSVEDSALAERRAALQLEEAREELAKASRLPIDSRVRREAQLAYDEAELNVRQTADRYSDLRQSLADASAAGVEGSEKVVAARQNEADAAQKVKDAQESLGDSQARLAKEQVDAQREVAEAQQKVADALDEQTQTGRQNARDLADAQQAVSDALEEQALTAQSNARDLADAQQSVSDALRDQQQTAEDNARALIDAQRSVADAQQSVADAVANAGAAAGGSTAALNAYNAAMANLSPQARQFVKYLISIQDEFKAVRNAAGEELFPKLETALREIVGNGSLKVLADGMRETGSAIGDVAIKFANLTSTPFFQGNFAAVMEGNATTIRTLGDAAVALAGYFVALFAAADPLVQRFNDWVLTLAQAQAATLDTGDEMQAMTDKFQRSGDIAAQIGRIISNLWQGIVNLGNAAQPAGQLLLDAFERATTGLRDLDSAANQSTLAAYFQGAAENTIALMGLFKDLAGVLLGLADDPAIGLIATRLRNEFIPILDEILNHATSEVGPELVTALVAIAQAFSDLSETGALTTFLGLITDFANTISSLLNGPLGPFITFIINLEAALAALAIIRNFSGIGYLAGALGTLGGAAKAIGVAGGPLSLISNQLAVFPIVGKAAAGVFDTIVLKGLYFLDSLKGLGATVGRLLTPALGLLQGALSAVGTALSFVGRALLAALGPVGLVIAGVSLLVAGLIFAYQHSETFRNIVDGALRAVGDAATYVFDNVLRPAFDWFVDALSGVGGSAQNFYSAYIKPAFDGVGRVIQSVWSGIIQPVFAAIGDAFSKLWNGFLKPIVDLIAYNFQFVFGNVIPAVFDLFKAIATAVFGAVVTLAKYLITGAFEAIQAAVNFMWNNVLKPVFGFIAAGWQLMIDGIQAYWRNVLLPVWNAIQTAANYLYNNVLKPVFGFISQSWTDTINLIKSVWTNILQPTWIAIQVAVTALFNNYIRPAFQSIMDKWNDVKNTIVNIYNNNIAPIWTALQTAVGKLGGYFESAVSAIKIAWSKVQDEAKKPVKFIIDTVVNKGIVGTFNKVADFFGSKTMTEYNPPGFATGGHIRGPGTGTSDSIPAWLSNGEYVVRAQAVKKFLPLLNAINYGRLGGGSSRGGGQAGSGGLPAFKGGGLVTSIADWIKGATGGITRKATDMFKEGVETFKSLSGAVFDIAKDPVGYFSAKLEGPMKGIGSSPFAQLATEAPREMISYAVDRIKGLFDAIGGGGDLTGGAFARGGDKTPNGVNGLGPAAQAARAYVMKNFGVNNIGGFAYRNIAGTGKLSDHATGHAIDVMLTPDYKSPAKRSLGNKIASYFSSNPKAFGTKYVIYFDQINSGSGWKPYKHPGGGGDTLQHRDHVHVSFFDKGGLAGGKGWMPKNTIQPERVLSPRQTAAFENLVPLLSSIPQLAAGGTVNPRMGGTLALLAEAGRAERVQPLGADGLTEGERQMIALLREMGTSAVNMTVNPPPEMDIVTLARLVSRELGWQMGA